MTQPWETLGLPAALIGILRCPFCGGRLELESGRSQQARDGELLAGILFCQCCAFPVVAGIPYLRLGPAAAAALRWLGEGNSERAFLTLMGLKEERQAEFHERFVLGRQVTFRAALEFLSPDLEGTYFFYRFSDPTFLACQAVLRAIGQDARCWAGWALDLCGGTGHLTRVLGELAGDGPVVLADIAFWKLWLARRYVAPDCLPVCCDASQPLPFARESFSLVHCADAFHYIWPRRLLAEEMIRQAGEQGVVVAAHLHNALCDNESAGMPLTTDAYRDLFERMDPRLFPESSVLDALLGGCPLDLSARFLDEELAGAPALCLVGSQLPGLFRQYERTVEPQRTQGLELNPLYQPTHGSPAPALTLRFPSPEYEAEYAACRRYLPESVALDDVALERLRSGRLDRQLTELAQRYVILDLPEGYCEEPFPGVAPSSGDIGTRSERSAETEG